MREITEEMVTAGLNAAKRWGSELTNIDDVSGRPPSIVFNAGEHPRTFIEDIIIAALDCDLHGKPK